MDHSNHTPSFSKTNRSPQQTSRRDFLKSGTFAAAGVGLLAGGARSFAQRYDFVTAVVIGSGFGGSVAALRLGQAGIDTVVLERAGVLA